MRIEVWFFPKRSHLSGLKRLRVQLVVATHTIRSDDYEEEVYTGWVYSSSKE